MFAWPFLLSLDLQESYEKKSEKCDEEQFKWIQYLKLPCKESHLGLMATEIYASATMNILKRNRAR